jgi:glycosyltransferase involved in cell wall biosynthesis
MYFRAARAQWKTNGLGTGFMRRVLFIDPVADRPYRTDSTDQRPLGGTEATLLRVARGLGKSGYEVSIAQSSRYKREMDRHGITYFPFKFRGELKCPRPDAVVCLRSYKIMPWLRRAFPSSDLYLWLHCFPGTRRRCIGEMAVEHNFTVLTVSHSHARFVERRCRIRPTVIYNPLEPGLERYRTAKDRNSLIYFSSPHKGLSQVLDTFRKVRERIPEVILKVANPGYIEQEMRECEGVVNLGALPHHKVLKEVASSFCVFYPQTTFAETFGLVFAEANALGTPVLAHDLGSAAEVLSNPDQIVDCADPARVIQRLERWRREGAPQVEFDHRFELDRVVSRWDAVLGPEAAQFSTERLVKAS